MKPNSHFLLELNSQKPNSTMATDDDGSPAIPIGEGLPEELINEILLRLPVKSLLRFKSVSKPWLSLISSPRFTNSHLHHTATTSQTFIVKEEDGDDDYKISLLHLDSCETGADLEFPYSKGEIPFVPDLILVGSCNGIVCAAVSNCARLDKFQLNTSVYDNREVYLWNPATKYSKLIPPHNIRNGIMSVYYGFGFDPIGNDFKVVRVVSSLYYPFSAEVYSANRNAWRKVEPGPGDVPDDYMFDVCVKGFLCCAGLYGLMVFDLNNEVFRCGIEFPVKSSDCRVTEFNDSVAIFMYSVEEELSTKFSLWTLDDECLRGEIGESWTLMFTFDVALDVDMVHGHLNSGNILLNTEDYEWFLYNYKKRTTTVAPISVYRLEVFNYTESLVSIQGFKQVEWNADEADD